MILFRTIATLLATLLCATSAVAGKVYKYVDENGVAHYSDRAPTAVPEAQVQTMHYRAENQSIATLKLDGNGEARRALAFNRLYGPVEVELVFSTQRNIIATPSLPLRLSIPPQRETALASFSIDEAHKGGHFELGLSAVPGDPTAEAANVLYSLPINATASWRVDQGFNGGFSHDDDQSRYAIDISADEGEPVLAARGGVIMQVEDDFEGSGLNREKFASRANYVRILHDDGSMALYAHLKADSVLVRGGQRVSVGQAIGRAGNTGYSTGPHLHFAVQVNTGMALQSIRFRMAGPDGELDLADPPR